MSNLKWYHLIIGIVLITGLSISGSLLLCPKNIVDENAAKQLIEEITGARTANSWQITGGKLEPNKDIPVNIINDLEFQDEIKPDGALCSNGEILKKTGADNWDCAADDDSGGGGTGGIFSTSSLLVWYDGLPMVIGGTATGTADTMFEVVGNVSFYKIASGTWEGDAIADAYIAGSAGWDAKWDGLDDMALAHQSIYVGDGSNNPVATNTITILDNGNVGIGTTTPIYALDVEGAIQTDTAFYGDNWISATGNSMNIQPTGDADDFFSFKTPADRPTIKREGGKFIYFDSSNVYDVGISLRDDDTYSGTLNYEKDNHLMTMLGKASPLGFKANSDYDDYIKIQTASNIPEITVASSSGFKINAGGTNHLLLNDAGGNVGIGTASPAYLLDVYGSVRLGATKFDGAVTGISLSEIENLTANKTFALDDKTLTWQFTNPDGGIYANVTGAFTGDAFHYHQVTGNPGYTHLMHVHAEDEDVIPLHVGGTASTTFQLFYGTGEAAFLPESAAFRMDANGDLEIDLATANATTTFPDNLKVLGQTTLGYATATQLTVDIVYGALVGNADTATALATGRTIAGVNFDGTANIDIPSTGLSDTADLLYEAELNTFSELQTQIADKTVTNVEDVFTLTGNWVNTDNPWADNEVADTLTASVIDLEAGTITNIASTEFMIGVGANDASYVSMSSDCTMDNTGAVTCDHDALDNFDANEHLDWTADLGATNIHAGNYTTLTDLTDFDQTAWRLFYSNNLGDVIELSLGTDGQYLQSQGGTASLTWSVPTNTTYTGGTNLTLDSTTFNVDDAFIVNDANDTMVGVLTADGLTLGANENITLGSQTLDHDGTDFVFNDSLKSSGIIYTSIGFDAVGNVDLDYGSADVDDHTFITDGTGDAEIVLPDGSISGTEILDDTIDSADYAAGSIDAEHLAADIIDETKIADNGIDSEHYNDDSIDAVHIDTINAGRSITWDATNDEVDADAETYIFKAKIIFEDPVATDDFFFEELTHAVTFTSIYCKTLVGTVDLDVTIAGTDINGADITCNTTGVLDDSLGGDTAGAVGEEGKLAITSVASAPTYLFVQLNGTYND